MDVAGLVLGVTGFIGIVVSGFVPYYQYTLSISGIIGVVALVFSAVSKVHLKRQSRTTGLANFGLLISIFVVAIVLFIGTLLFVAISSMADSFD